MVYCFCSSSLCGVKKEYITFLVLHCRTQRARVLTKRVNLQIRQNDCAKKVEQSWEARIILQIFVVLKPATLPGKVRGLGGRNCQRLRLVSPTAKALILCIPGSDQIQSSLQVFVPHSIKHVMRIQHLTTASEKSCKVLSRILSNL